MIRRKNRMGLTKIVSPTVEASVLKIEGKCLSLKCVDMELIPN